MLFKIYEHDLGYKWLKTCTAEEGFDPEDARKIFSTYDKNRDDYLDRYSMILFFLPCNLNIS